MSLPSPFFDSHPETVHQWTGHVDQIDENGVGFGNTDVAVSALRTFEFPIPDGYGIGTRVEMYDTSGNLSANHDMLGLALSPDEQRMTLYFIAVQSDGSYHILDEFESLRHAS